jgi:ABC-2 type transport system permease protein
MLFSTGSRAVRKGWQTDMKQFLSFVRKEFIHIFRDRWTMVIILILPVVMLILFGYALNTEVRNTSIAVCDPSDDYATCRIIEALDHSQYFDVVQRLPDPDGIDTVFREGKIGLAVVFSNDFYDNLAHTGEAEITLVADGSDPNTAISRVNYATGIINSCRAELTGTGDTPYQITATTRLLYNPEMKSAYNFVPGVIGMILMLVCAMMSSVSIVREKEQGTMELLLVSPMRPILIILSKLVPYLVLSCLNLATILVLAVFMLGVPVAGSFFWLIVTALLFIFVSLSLGLLISTVAETQLAALLVSVMALMLPVMLLSGMMFPIDNMPVFLQVIANILPAKWFISAARKLMIQGLGFHAITGELAVLSLMAAVLITVSLKNFKVRLE